MSRRKTHEEFINELENCNPNILEDFKIINKYTGVHNKIIMEDDYGLLQMDACKLLSGKYPNAKSVINKTEYYINKSISVHGNKYDYSKSIYTSSKKKTNIICKKHGEFKQTFPNHINGHGCKLCGYNKTGKARKKSTSDFIREAKKIHGGKYNYSLADYKGSEIKIKLVCKTHGVFLQRPNNHLNGKGCHYCNNVYYNKWSAIKYSDKFKNIKSGLYIIEMSNDNERFYKIGITKKKVKHRFDKLKVYDYFVIGIIKDTLYRNTILEDYIHQLLKKYSYEPQHYFSGYTECFYDIDDVIIEFAYANLNNRIKLIEKEVDKYD